MTISKTRQPDLSARTIRRLTRTLADVDPEGRLEVAMHRRAHAVLQSLRNLPVAILVANDKGRYVDVNRAAVTLTGYTRRELLTCALWDLTPNVRQTLGRRLWRDFLDRGRMAGIYELRQKNGEIVRARYVAVAHVLPGIHVSALAAVRPTKAPTRRRKPAA